MKKIVAIILVILSLAALIVPLAGCGSDAEAQTQTTQVVAVQRGNIEITIAASGNLALSDKEDLAFEIGGTLGGTNGTAMTVDQVLVEEGDMVAEGQVLAKLDESTWQDYLDTLKNAVTTAQRNQTSKERTQTSALRQVETKQNALTAAQQQVPAKELALRQAQLNLQTAEYNLEQLADVKAAQEQVDDAQRKYDLALTLLENARQNGDPNGELDGLSLGVRNAQQTLSEAQALRQKLLTLSDTSLSTNVTLDITSRILAVDQAQNAVNSAQTAIDDARIAIQTAQDALDDANLAVEDAETAIEDAKKSVAEAQETLDEAQAKSIQIVAPFDGFITAVNVSGGDEVNKGTVACTIADPDKFESYIMINELDMSKVSVGSTATVTVDAVNGVTFPAKVTHIAPTATVTSGVVSFKVKVELDSLATTQGSQQQTATSSTGSQNIQLREGLTAIVNIIVNRRENVLMVPIKAITTEGGQAYVQVVSADGTLQKRAVTRGISNSLYTEVTQGLSDGEKVAIVKSTSSKTTATTTTTTQQQGGGMMIPGLSGGGGPPPGGP